MGSILFKAADRGESNLGWLQSRFSYSFADYHNPRRMGFGNLRVVNDDVIASGQGFGDHAHRDMEIITIVTQGELAHKDSMGNQGVIRVGDVQVMSAGTGVVHSEFNHSSTDEVKLFQIWIRTNKPGVNPRYVQKSFKLILNDVTEVVSGDKQGDQLFMYADAKINLVRLDGKKILTYKLPRGRGLFVMVVEGSVIIDDTRLDRRDAVEITAVDQIIVRAEKNAFLFLIEVQMK